MRRLGDVEAEVEIAAARLAAVVSLAKDGIGAEADSAELRIEIGVNGVERRQPGVGNGNRDELILVVVAELDRAAAGVGEKLTVRFGIERLFAVGQVTAEL